MGSHHHPLVLPRPCTVTYNTSAIGGPLDVCAVVSSTSSDARAAEGGGIVSATVVAAGEGYYHTPSMLLSEAPPPPPSPSTYLKGNASHWVRVTASPTVPSCALPQLNHPAS